METSVPDRSLQDAREDLGLSQRELASRLGISAGYIALIETGRRPMSAQLYRRLQQVLAATGDSKIAGADLLVDWKSRRAEFDMALPADDDWFSQIPFTVVTGGPGSGKSTFLAQWLAAVQQRTSRRALWVSLRALPDDPLELARLLMVSSGRSSSLIGFGGESGSASAAEDLAASLERRGRSPSVIGIDDWLPEGGPIHAFVARLGLALRRTPVVAVNASTSPAAPGAVVLPVPEVPVESWVRWCEHQHVPPERSAELRSKIHGNPLAATYLRGSVFAASGLPGALQPSATWDRLIGELPTRIGVPWLEIADACRRGLGAEAWTYLTVISDSPEPIPMNRFEDPHPTGLLSRLLQYRLLEVSSGSSGPEVAVHHVLADYIKRIGPSEAFDLVSELIPGPASVEYLLAGGQYEDAANVISDLLPEWLRRAEAPSRIVDWLQQLPSAILSGKPSLTLALARSLALRGQTGDTETARSVLGELLLDESIGEGVRWAALSQAADVAIRACDYVEAQTYIDELEGLSAAAPGVFDAIELAVLAARAQWEQAKFEAADALLSPHSPSSDAAGARLSSWRARAFASLGDFVAAVEAARLGMNLSRTGRIPRAEAYNAVLLAEFELLRGNFPAAKKLVERALARIAGLGQPNLEAQALAVSAEAAAFQLRRSEAKQLIDEAERRIKKRSADRWGNAYLLITKARVARVQPERDQLSSLAGAMLVEAEILGRQSPDHPVIQALTVEAAWCWAAAGYVTRAAQVLNGTRRDRADWRTRWEYKRVRLTTVRLSPSQFDEAVVGLIEEASAAGCPYLAATTGYVAALQSWRQQQGDEQQRWAIWTQEVSSSRGWKVLALMSRALYRESDAAVAEEAHGQVVTNPDGTISLLAPPRPQHPARSDPKAALPDPFEN
jgi:transcriptional regulator with XRE-family HTH domain